MALHHLTSQIYSHLKSICQATPCDMLLLEFISRRCLWKHSSLIEYYVFYLVCCLYLVTTWSLHRWSMAVVKVATLLWCWAQQYNRKLSRLHIGMYFDLPMVRFTHPPPQSLILVGNHASLSGSAQCFCLLKGRFLCHCRLSEHSRWE